MKLTHFTLSRKFNIKKMSPLYVYVTYVYICILDFIFLELFLRSSLNYKRTEKKNKLECDQNHFDGDFHCFFIKVFMVIMLEL